MILPKAKWLINESGLAISRKSPFTFIFTKPKCIPIYFVLQHFHPPPEDFGNKCCSKYIKENICSSMGRYFLNYVIFVLALVIDWAAKWKQSSLFQ